MKLNTKVLVVILLLTGVANFQITEAQERVNEFRIEVNSGIYERVAQEAKESNEGLSVEELARFFSRNLTISSTAEEPIKSRLIILFMDGKGNIINRYGLDAEELSNRRMRLGRLMSSSQIAAMMRESVPSTNWIPSTQWLSDNVEVRSIDELQRVAGQMAIKWEMPNLKSEFDELFALRFALTSLGNEFDKSSSNLAVFSLYIR